MMGRRNQHRYVLACVTSLPSLKLPINQIASALSIDRLMRSGYNTERRSVNLYLSIESIGVQAFGDPITEVKSICRETQRACCYPWSGERCWSLRWQTDSAQCGIVSLRSSCRSLHRLAAGGRSLLHHSQLERRSNIVAHSGDHRSATFSRLHASLDLRVVLRTLASIEHAVVADNAHHPMT